MGDLYTRYYPTKPIGISAGGSRKYRGDHSLKATEQGWRLQLNRSFYFHPLPLPQTQYAPLLVALYDNQGFLGPIPGPHGGRKYKMNGESCALRKIYGQTKDLHVYGVNNGAH